MTPGARQDKGDRLRSSADGVHGSSRRGWSLIATTAREEWVGIALGMLAGLLYTAGRVAVPLLIQLGLDRGVQEGGPLLPWSLAIVGAGLFSATFLGFRRYLAFRNARIIEARLRDRIFAHVQRLHFSFHDANATGELMSRGNTDLQHFQNFVTLVPLTFGNFLIVVTVTIIMLILQPL
ncbi:MAG: ABC transporter transmembrane domain-containing protein, partial [Acidimicrobiales bacterium]|nr:ABC transporter transmembrane domain-containing protein [Acidimicrobiales bacterium]